jgi:hypothetical protein
MFFIHADITIQSDLEFEGLAQAISQALVIFPFKLDDSGKYEGDKIFISTCFGLDFELAQDEEPLTTYHFSVNSNVDLFDFDGSEEEIDWSQYIADFLRHGQIDATIRDPNLLYG